MVSKDKRSTGFNNQSRALVLTAALSRTLSTELTNIDRVITRDGPSILHRRGKFKKSQKRKSK